jgi:hypothetical protein
MDNNNELADELYDAGIPEESRVPEFRREDLASKLMDFQADPTGKNLADVYLSARWAERSGLVSEASLARAQMDLMTAAWGPKEERDQIFRIVTASRASELKGRLDTTGSLWRKP